MAQARHARAVHSFICELLALVMPDLVKGSEYIKSSTEFCDCIDNAIKDATTTAATEDDYIRAILDAVGRKVDGLRLKGRRRGRYSESQRRVCVVCWNKAKRSAELRYSSNGRVTYEMAFEYSRRELSDIGIDDVKKFRAVLHSVRNMECEDRRRALEAKRGESVTTPRGDNHRRVQ